MLDCFVTYDGAYVIPVRVCAETESESGYFANVDLPGNPLEAIEKLASSEQQTWKGVYEDVYNRALRALEREVFTELQKCFRIKTKQCARDLICENAESFYLTLLYLIGWELMWERLYSPRWNKWTIDKESAQALRADYWSLALREMKSAIDTIDIDVNTECFQCGGTANNLVHKTTLP